MHSATATRRPIGHRTPLLGLMSAAEAERVLAATTAAVPPRLVADVLEAVAAGLHAQAPPATIH